MTRWFQANRARETPNRRQERKGDKLDACAKRTRGSCMIEQVIP